MIDSSPPSRQPHNRKNKPAQQRSRFLTRIEARFVYENELRGTWFRVYEAVTRNLPILPNPEFTVIRIEFRDLDDL